MTFVGGSVSQNFPDIFKNLIELKDLMQCSCCNEHMNTPVTLWSCDHVFCEKCITSCTSCPECNMPAWPEDISKNRRLQNISSLCNQLENCLYKTFSLSHETKFQNPNTDITCTDALRQKNSFLKRSKKTDCLITDFETKRKKPETVVSKNLNITKTVTTPKRNVTPKSGSQSLQKNMKGETPLHLAAMLGDLIKVENYLKTKVNVNAKDHAGWTPLHEACNQGHVKVVEKLLDAGAFIDIPGYENETPLIDAVSNNRLSVVELLLKRGANVFLRNSAGKTALDLASNSKVRSLISQFVTSSSLSEEDDSFSKDRPDNIIIGFSSSTNLKKIKSLCKLVGASLSHQNAFGCTHFIVSFNNELKTVRSLKYLQAMASGAWIVTEKWVEKCLDSKGWVNELNFQVKGCYEDALLEGPMQSRKAKIKCLPRLFDGCHFFLFGRFSSPLPSKPQLIELIKEAGGLILNREPKPDNDIIQSCQKVPYHACPNKPEYYFTYYIVYDPSQKFLPRTIRLGKVCTVSALWVLDCLSQFKICDIL